MPQLVKSPRDHAIISGINIYKNRATLKGAVSDADRFRKWLLREDGGGLDVSKIQQIPNPNDDQPRLWDLINGFKRLIDASQNYQKRVGRRLYIYLAGHGVGAGRNGVSLDPKDAVEVGLMDVEYSENFHSYLAAWKFAQLFSAKAIFDEIVLLMDCCRDYIWNLTAPYFPFPNTEPDFAANSKVRRFYAYAVCDGYQAQ